MNMYRKHFLGTIQQQEQFSDFEKKKKDFIYKSATLRFDRMGPSSEIFLVLLRNCEEQLSEKNHFRNLSKEKRKNEHVLKFFQFFLIATISNGIKYTVQVSLVIRGKKHVFSFSKYEWTKQQA